MKFVVLLALVGLASCRTAIVGGDRSRDVTIEYSYLDDQGREVEVEVKSDKLGLDLSRPDSLLSTRPTVIPDVARVSRVDLDSLPQIEARPRFVKVEREPEQIVTRFIEVEDHPIRKPRVETGFVQVASQPIQRTRTETRFVQVAAEPAPRTSPVRQFVNLEPIVRDQEFESLQFFDADDITQPEVRFVQVASETRRPELETRFVSVEAPRREIVSHFVQQARPAPSSRPLGRPQFVEVEHPVVIQAPSTLSFQAPRPIASPTARFQVAHHAEPVTSFTSSFDRHSSSRRHSSSDDNSAEK